MLSRNPSFVAADSTKTDAATDTGENDVGALSRNHIRLRAEGAVDLGGEGVGVGELSDGVDMN
jgi:hypothetical protein